MLDQRLDPPENEPEAKPEGEIKKKKKKVRSKSRKTGDKTLVTTEASYEKGQNFLQTQKICALVKLKSFLLRLKKVHHCGSFDL